MKNATYVEAARRGSHRWWRYLLGLVIIFFAWLVVGTVASLLVAIALSGQTNYAALSPVGQFLYIMAGFPFFLAGILLTVSLVHRRPLLTLITAREKDSTSPCVNAIVADYLINLDLPDEGTICTL